MPVRKVKTKRGTGYRTKGGKTYYGRGAKAKAKRQQRAIKATQLRKKKK